MRVIFSDDESRRRYEERKRRQQQDSKPKDDMSFGELWRQKQQRDQERIQGLNRKFDRKWRTATWHYSFEKHV